ncbi:nucleic acid/nucleotide deaminase domain-containing protein [Nonomuraea guangzhouensis]|uniref:Nucleic acid/nucleotide deaminase domain-containing protein n=1 Tax=Nonomuraea guangzhouensis TaxID=1291555 RepID=A0ABW4GU67_9ACTN|nr:nucleic acid/nucleotide deaminase domain-containing protein [Nonomuraea guangzhouensis]
MGKIKRNKRKKQPGSNEQQNTEVEQGGGSEGGEKPAQDEEPGSGEQSQSDEKSPQKEPAGPPVGAEPLVKTKQVTSPAPPGPDLTVFTLLPPDIGRYIVRFLPFASLMNLLAINPAMRRWMSSVVQQSRNTTLSAAATGFWLKHCAKPQFGDSPITVLEMVRQINRQPYDERVWSFVGKLVDSDFTHWSEILGELAILRGEFGDVRVLEALTDLLPTEEEKRALKEGYVGVAAKVDPLRLMTATDPPETMAVTTAGVTGTDEQAIRDLVHDRLRTRFNTIKTQVAGKGSTQRRQQRTDATAPEQRALDRLSWVLTHLQDARQCVSVALSKNNMRVWANVPDDSMRTDLERLFAAATAGTEQLQQQLDSLWRDLHNSSLDKRSGKPDEKEWHDAERRLLKTLRFLGGLLDEWAKVRMKVRLSARTTAYEGTGEERVHTETQASDEAKHSRDKLKADLEELEEATGITVMLQEMTMAIGISKLSCFKCWITLLAAREEGVNLEGSGTHGKSYGKWTMPFALGSSPQVLKAILGVTDSEQDEDLTRLIENPVTAPMVVKAINIFPEQGAAQKTIYYSSEDETDLKFTKHPTEPPKRKASDSGPTPVQGKKVKPDSEQVKPKKEEFEEPDEIIDDGDDSGDEDYHQPGSEE